MLTAMQHQLRVDLGRELVAGGDEPAVAPKFIENVASLGASASLGENAADTEVSLHTPCPWRTTVPWRFSRRLAGSIDTMTRVALALK